MEASFIEESVIKVLMEPVISKRQLPCLFKIQAILILATMVNIMQRFIMELMYERFQMFECRISLVTVGNLMISRILLNLMMVDDMTWFMLVVVNKVVLMVCLGLLINIMI